MASHEADEPVEPVSFTDVKELDETFVQSFSPSIAPVEAPQAEESEKPPEDPTPPPEPEPPQEAEAPQEVDPPQETKPPEEPETPPETEAPEEAAPPKEAEPATTIIQQRKSLMAKRRDRTPTTVPSTMPIWAVWAASVPITAIPSATSTASSLTAMVG